jgi:ribosomal protein L32
LRRVIKSLTAFEKYAVKQGSGEIRQHKTCLSDVFYREFFVLETADAVLRMFFKKP